MSQYSLTYSLNDGRLYIKIIDTLTYLCYEGNFNGDIYDICLKSFEEMTVKISIHNKCMKLIFDLVEPFELILKNTLLSIEQLTINYHKQICENIVLTKSLEAKISENTVLTKRLEHICENTILTKRLEEAYDSIKSTMHTRVIQIYASEIKYKNISCGLNHGNTYGSHFSKDCYQYICNNAYFYVEGNYEKRRVDYPQFVQININSLNIWNCDLYENIELLYNLEILLIYINDESIKDHYLNIKNSNVTKIIFIVISIETINFNIIFENFPNLCEIEYIDIQRKIGKLCRRLEVFSITTETNLKDILEIYPNKIKSIKTSPSISHQFALCLKSFNIEYETLVY